MVRKKVVDPTVTADDRKAMRNHRTAKLTGKLGRHAQEVAETREERLERARKTMAEAAMAKCEKSLEAQARERLQADAELLGNAAKISDEQLVEVIFENFKVSAIQVIERLARFDANEMRRQLLAR